ncbi:MAG: hypothetical protein QOE90_1847 [Thermoplasmata archaeon]|jgi:hypothetical protein|nr:hypothetical protein [Thermoplasmata archaeon]
MRALPLLLAASLLLLLVPAASASTSIPAGGWCGSVPRYACFYMVIDCTTVCGSAMELCVYWNGHGCVAGTQPPPLPSLQQIENDLGDLIAA